MSLKLWMISFVLFSFAAHADVRTTPADVMEWMRIEIPGTQCGDGSPYAIFVDEIALSKPLEQRSRSIIMQFQGGGACQNRETCSNAAMSAPDTVVPFPGFPVQSIFTKNDRISPYAHFSKIYFPYCTGDVFIGNHTADYEGMTVHHKGRHNVEKAVDYLKSLFYLFDFEKSETVSIYGFSAGAIGALYHAPQLAPLFQNASNKSVVVDAPGLHFGKEFWGTFTPELIVDYKAGLKSIGYDLQETNGLVAGVVPLVCELMPDWNIGVLQSSQDMFMSWGFGKIDQEEHHQLVIGPHGLHRLTEQNHDNCASWIPFDSTHTYLHMDDDSLQSINGKTAMQFAWDITSGKKMPNFIGEPERTEKAELDFASALIFSSFGLR